MIVHRGPRPQRGSAETGAFRWIPSPYTSRIVKTVGRMLQLSVLVQAATGSPSAREVVSSVSLLTLLLRSLSAAMQLTPAETMSDSPQITDFSAMYGDKRRTMGKPR